MHRQETKTRNDKLKIVEEKRRRERVRLDDARRKINKS